MGRHPGAGRPSITPAGPLDDPVAILDPSTAFPGNRRLPSRFYLVLLSFTGFYWVLLGFTGFYWVLLGFTGFDWV